jgi:hypothetical protein
MTPGEKRLAWPVRREVKPDAAHAAAHSPGDFEELETDGADRRRCQARPGEDTSAEVREQEAGEAVQLQPEGIRAEAMTAKPVGVDVELELLDPIFGGAAIVVPGHKIRGAAATVRDHEPEVEPLRGDVDLDQDATRVRPRFRAMLKARADVDGPAGRSYRACAVATRRATRVLKTRLVPMPSTYGSPSASAEQRFALLRRGVSAFWPRSAGDMYPCRRETRADPDRVRPTRRRNLPDRARSPVPGRDL